MSILITSEKIGKKWTTITIETESGILTIGKNNTSGRPFAKLNDAIRLSLGQVASIIGLDDLKLACSKISLSPSLVPTEAESIQPIIDAANSNTIQGTVSGKWAVAKWKSWTVGFAIDGDMRFARCDDRKVPFSELHTAMNGAGKARQMIDVARDVKGSRNPVNVEMDLA